jgi:serine phosphatase RsbU (regulator of sigma subunit)
LLFYTDGVTDRVARSGAMYDLDRLSDAFARLGDQTAAAIVAALVDDVERFAEGQEADDDMTLLVLALGGATA